MATLVTGGTGFVGEHLIPLLDDVYVTSRNATRARQKLARRVTGVIEWDPAQEALDLGGHEKFAAVVNLMGESIAEGRWTEAKKKRIRDSRVSGTRKLVDALLKMPSLPDVVVSTSAVGIYGNSGDEIVDEFHPAAAGFLADVCLEWEQAVQPIAEAGVRVVLIRVGIVLGREGGALKKLVPLFKMCAGGKLGNGKQYVPWIHIQDLVRMYQWSIQNRDVSGPVNGSAPNPVTNADFTRALASAVNRPAVIPVPGFALKLALGEFGGSLLNSQRVVPRVALEHGFEFKYSQIQPALEALL